MTVDRHAWAVAIEGERFNAGLLAGDPCPLCGEIVGHFGGSNDRDQCGFIRSDVFLREVRPNCYTVRFHTMADTIRSAR